MVEVFRLQDGLKGRACQSKSAYSREKVLERKRPREAKGSMDQIQLQGGKWLHLAAYNMDKNRGQ